MTKSNGKSPRGRGSSNVTKIHGRRNTDWKKSYGNGLSYSTFGECPKMHCDGTLRRKTGRYGPFIGCSNFPKCRYSQSLHRRKPCFLRLRWWLYGPSRSGMVLGLVAIAVIAVMQYVNPPKHSPVPSPSDNQFHSRKAPGADGRDSMKRTGLRRVIDGDTIVMYDGTRVRLAKLNCAERDTAKGKRATAKMRELVKRGTVSCNLNGERSYNRMIGKCYVDGERLGTLMVQSGVCRWY